MTPDQPTVRVGQVWADNDKRGYGRRVRIVDIEAAVPAGPHHRAVPAKAVVVPVDSQGRLLSSRARKTRIRLDRFRPTSTGYRLVQETPDA